MTFSRRFTRPLLNRVDDHSTAFLEILAARAEVDHLLADHLLAALVLFERSFQPDDDNAPTPRK